MKRRIRVILPSLLFFSFLSFGQANYSRLAALYDYVDKADSISARSLRTFYLEKFLPDNYNYREAWRYSLTGGQVVYFQIDYILDSTEFTEVYYLNRNRLVCSEEYEKINHSFNEDQLRWGGVYYFQSTEPKHVVTLGRKDLARHGTNPEQTALYRFEKRLSELKRHMPMLP